MFHWLLVSCGLYGRRIKDVAIWRHVISILQSMRISLKMLLTEVKRSGKHSVKFAQIMLCVYKFKFSIIQGFFWLCQFLLIFVGVTIGLILKNKSYIWCCTACNRYSTILVVIQPVKVRMTLQQIKHRDNHCVHDWSHPHIYAAHWNVFYKLVHCNLKSTWCTHMILQCTIFGKIKVVSKLT